MDERTDERTAGRRARRATWLAATLLLPMLGGAPGAGAADTDRPADLQPLDAAPPPPPPIRSGEVLEPDVRIVEGSDGVVTEYRVGGKLVAIKVDPSAGPSYYLIDADGDGDLDTQTRELSPGWVHAWVILRW